MAYFFADSPQAVVRKSYGSHPFEEAKKIALYLRANSEPDDRIVVLGSEPQIYFYADRRAATGFLYTYPLMEPQPYAVQTQEDMIAQIEQEDPRFLVVVEVPHSWLPRKSSSHLIFDWANRYVSAHYRCVGVADMISQNLTAYRWGKEAEDYKAFSQFAVYLFARTASR